MPHKADDQVHAYFVTFSCYKNRRLLDDDGCKAIVVSVMNSQLKRREGRCAGFVVMPDHVHAVIRFAEDGKLAEFMKQWKRLTSVQIKRRFQDNMPEYGLNIDPSEPVWQRRYYSFNIVNPDKLNEKLDYMHGNPVRAGLVESPTDWAFSSSRHYERGKSVGVQVEALF